MTDEDERRSDEDGSASATDESTDDGAAWRFDPAEFDGTGPDANGAAEDPDHEPADAADEEDGNVAGSLFDLEEDLEPGTPTLEGTLFVVLGALTTLLFLLEAGGAI